MRKWWRRPIAFGELFEIPYVEVPDPALEFMRGVVDFGFLSLKSDGLISHEQWRYIYRTLDRPGIGLEFQGRKYVADLERIVKVEWFGRRQVVLPADWIRYLVVRDLKGYKWVGSKVGRARQMMFYFEPFEPKEFEPVEDMGWIRKGDRDVHGTDVTGETR